MRFEDNMTDTGGMFVSFATWKKTKGRDVRLPGLSFTPEQLFCIIGAQEWCDNLTPAEESSYLLESYGVNAARIKIPKNNSVGSREVFNCQQKKMVCEL